MTSDKSLAFMTPLPVQNPRNLLSLVGNWLTPSVQTSCVHAPLKEDRLDQQIRFLINDIQNKIEIAKTTIEDSIAFSNLKKTTQGWAIVVGSWKDILSDWVGQDFSSDQAATFGE